jgi:hypothetical protein
MVNEIAQLTAERDALIKALKVYANKAEWSVYHGSHWKLMFNSAHRDGDGWETAAEALANIDKEESK